jgi:ABC-type polysaccharide/polyol phosphate export permease
VLYFYGEVPGWLRNVLRLNPMSHILVSYQEMLFMGVFAHGKQLLVTFLVSLLVFAFGAFFFDRLRDTLAEEV